MKIKHKLEQIEASLEHQNEDVQKLVKDICEGIEKKILKNDFLFNFTVNKDAKVFNDIKKVIGIFFNFDIKINEVKNTEKQIIYCVYFNKE